MVLGVVGFDQILVLFVDLESIVVLIRAVGLLVLKLPGFEGLAEIVIGGQERRRTRLGAIVIGGSRKQGSD